MVLGSFELTKILFPANSRKIFVMIADFMAKGAYCLDDFFIPALRHSPEVIRARDTRCMLQPCHSQGTIRQPVHIVPEDDGSPFGSLDKVMKGLERIISGLQDREQALICIYRKK